MTTLPKTTTPDLRFLLSHPAHFLALGFGSGLSRIAPGTFGTLVALPLSYFWLHVDVPVLYDYLLIISLFIIGIPICTIAGKNLGVADHGSIVWDEIVAMLLVLEFTPYTPNILWVAAFLLFRLFDIWKPFPIRQFDAKLKNGFGVMFDDLLAAIYTIIAIKGLMWVFAPYFHPYGL